MAKLGLLFFVLMVFVVVNGSFCSMLSDSEKWDVGVGIADITGPINSEGMMGYALFNQRSSGLHMRLRARAFIFIDPITEHRVAFVSLDTAMVFQVLKTHTVQRLKELYGEVYSDSNVVLSAIHSHSGPGGYSWNTIFDVTTLGFNEKNTGAIVDGIIESIKMAHENVVENCRIRMSTDDLLDTSISRSPTSYTANPEAERKEYAYDVDKEMLLLSIVDSEGNPVGMLNWFPVHGVSLPNFNKLVSCDNKGLASIMVEGEFNHKGPGEGPFVAGFLNSNEADVTANTRGQFCPNGQHCEPWTSSCDGSSKTCQGQGPAGQDWFQNMWDIGEKQATHAMSLFTKSLDTGVPITASIDYRHRYINMTNVEVTPEFSRTNKTGHTCPGAFGYSMSAGTSDGPSGFDFLQGQNNTKHSNPFWAWLSDFIAKPTPEQIKCHAPKPIILDIGQVHPIPWNPEVLPLQIVRLGQLFVVAVPVEMTTMLGRRLRKDVLKAINDAGGIGDQKPIIVITGLSNAYSDYCTTYEEYQFQRYEAGSTAYGPHEGAAFRQEYSKIAFKLVLGDPIELGPPPVDLSNHTWNFNPPDVVDEHPPFKEFGSIHEDVKSSYHQGDTVSVTFWGAQPRTDYMIGKSYLTIEQKNGDDFDVVYSDAHFHTRLIWKEYLEVMSHITVEWDVGHDETPGTYRIRHFGHSRSLLGKLTPYVGTSSEFTVS